MRRHAAPDLSSSVSWKPSPPHPPLARPNYINEPARLVFCPQSTSAEVTKQVAANKALRGQLQEKEDKLRQLQDKSVCLSFFFFSN